MNISKSSNIITIGGLFFTDNNVYYECLNNKGIVGAESHKIEIGGIYKFVVMCNTNSKYIITGKGDLLYLTNKEFESFKEVVRYVK